MPNHETNTVVVIGTPENVNKFREEAFNEDGNLDFDLIKPMPEELRALTAEYKVFPTKEEAIAHQQEMEERYAEWPEELRKQYIDKVHALTETEHAQLQAKYGPALDWYSWNCLHWGTKWNAYSHGDVTYGEYVSYETKEVYGRLDFAFETAWTAPTPIFEAIEDQWDVELHAVSQDEGGFPDVVYGDPYYKELLQRVVTIEPLNWDEKVGE